MVNLIALQMTSGPVVEANLDFVERQLSLLPKSEQPSLVALPECFALFGAGEQAMLKIAEPEGEGVIQNRLAHMAKTYGVWLVGGTIPLQTEQADKFAAASLMFDDQGQQQARYDKIHLFDVSVADNTRVYKESKHTRAGEQVVCVDSPFGRLGLSVCYDLRFAGLYHAMGGVDVILVPSAFTKVTGQAHWHALLQARAIENQAFVLAPNQSGKHANGRETFGHSCVYSPWGELLGELPEGPGPLPMTVDLKRLREVREAMPVLQHDKFRSHFID